MPVYEFICPACGLRFDRLSKMSESDIKEVPCKECRQPARRTVSAVNHTFRHGASQTNGIAPSNTGTSDDWNYDKVIGRDAEQKWRVIEQRQAEKNRVLRNTPGATSADLRKTKEGYEVMPSQERQAIETARAVGSAAIKSGSVGDGGKT